MTDSNAVMNYQAAKPKTAVSSDTLQSQKRALLKDKTDFLKLLTTQLKNQNPNAPMDSNQFSQQIIHMSQAEQALNTNLLLQELVSINKTAHNDGALSFIGKEVEVANAWSMLKNGQAAFHYELPAEASKAFITVYDGDGKKMFFGLAPTARGDNVFTWDGRTNDGTLVDNGRYRFALEAFTADGDAVHANLNLKAVVDGVAMNAGSPILLIGDQQVPLREVLSAKQPSSESSN